MNLDIVKLEALAKAATQGEWGYDGSYVCTARIETGTKYVETWNAVADCNLPDNAKFIAAANPAAVLELVAQVETLTQIFSEAPDLPESDAEWIEKLKALKAENECLRKNSTRYEWLRSEHTRPGCLSSDPHKAKWLDEYLICGDKLDAAIDEQLAKVK